MEVVKINSPLISDFAVLFQRIMNLAQELDAMREHYRELYQRIESGEIGLEEGNPPDRLKEFNVAGFVHLSIVAARSAQTAAMIANSVSLSRVFDPSLKDYERAFRHIESRAT
ncbi:MAG: hypothetical protein B7Y05_04340 [Polynucleobacter sp. 24-46-87]|jgi:hypothetical protein|uniref:hypothetical protein n=1 Tax=Polynucleobacter sp. 39-46-10 TaxID=1970428 RepID=UPI000BCCEDEF|nr:hypothetical protein [Polynucleobacter sp. 39-46-10]OZA15333.1 MAG: hypothetical protein B7Y05_04340 [Polynucleobacter sp. 24-46-87]OZA77551.1 MAG: hypothetical protein B7X71_04545 [Polynucleobacter sp. 39-46-10]